MHNLDIFLTENHISKDSFYDTVLQCFLSSIFLQVYSHLETDNNKLQFKKVFRKCQNKLQEDYRIDSLLASIMDVKLSELQRNYIRLMVRAYLRKEEWRKPFTDGHRKQLVRQQNGKCNYCGENIEYSSCHIDHIVPFRLVGDELEENYQALCQKCNQSKADNPFYPFLHFLRLKG